MSQYEEDLFEHYVMDSSVNLCDHKLEFLREYYKKRDRWVNDEEGEYMNAICLLEYIHESVLGATNQAYFDCVTMPLLTVDAPKILIDGEYKLRDDIIECIDYYKNGFHDEDEERTANDSEYQTKIVEIIHKLNHNPNYGLIQ